jgi:glycosyltransferase involved in cell wall biosynthesis
MGLTDASAVLCGDGPERASVERWITTRHLGTRFALTGFVPHPWSFMKAATALVAPSLFEGYPNVVLEAMACGCPVIVSDIPAHRAFLDEGSAVFVDPLRDDSIASGIQSVIGNPEGAIERARRAREVASRFQVDAMGAQYEAIYEAVLRQRRRGAA